MIFSLWIEQTVKPVLKFVEFVVLIVLSALFCVWVYNNSLLEIFYFIKNYITNGN